MGGSTSESPMVSTGRDIGGKTNGAFGAKEKVGTDGVAGCKTGNTVDGTAGAVESFTTSTVSFETSGTAVSSGVAAKNTGLGAATPTTEIFKIAELGAAAPRTVIFNDTSMCHDPPSGGIEDVDPGGAPGDTLTGVAGQHSGAGVNSFTVSDEVDLDEQEVANVQEDIAKVLGSSQTEPRGRVTAVDIPSMSASDMARKSRHAEQFLASIHDDGYSSLGVDLPCGGVDDVNPGETKERKNNKVIPPDALTSGERPRVWSFCIEVLKKFQKRGFLGAGGSDFPNIDYDRVLRTVKEGVRPEFIDEAPEKLPRSRRRNLIPEDESLPSVWTDEQVSMMAKGKMIMKEPYPGFARIISMLFLVDKDGGGGYRLIMDVREFNKWCKKKGFSLHTLNKGRYVYYDLAGLATDDLTSSYGHLRIHPDIQPYIAFRRRGITWIVLASPYGMSPLPELFQSCASIGPRINYSVGLSPLLLTAKDWTDVATGRRPMPAPKDRYSIVIKQFLDDYMKAARSSLRSMSGVIVQGDNVLPLFKLLAESFRGLMRALGFVISPKSQPVKQVNKFIGFDIFAKLKGGSFGIPVKKVTKNATIFREAVAKATWTVRETAALASRILQFKLIWHQRASMIARPLYFRLGREVTDKSSWNDVLVPEPLEREMVQAALDLLVGPKRIITAPVIVQHREFARLWAAKAWDDLKRTGNCSGILVSGDSSDYMIGAWVTELPFEKLANVLEHKIVANGHKLKFWSSLSVVEQRKEIEAGDGLVFTQMLTPDEQLESSTWRELLLIARFYQDEKRMAELFRLLERAGGKALFHATDSQAAFLMLMKGASGSPRCHRLVMLIWDLTEPLRRKFGWFCGWMPREAAAARIADEFSKTKNHVLQREVFAALPQKFGFDFTFDLDAFSSWDDAMVDASGKRLPFCSRTMQQESLGDGRSFPWQGRTVWAFPTPEVDMLVEIALNKAESHDGVAVVCLASWQYLKHHARYRSYSFVKKFELPPGSSRRILRGPGQGTNGVVYTPSRFKLVLLVFDHR